MLYLKENNIISENLLYNVTFPKNEVPMDAQVKVNCDSTVGELTMTLHDTMYMFLFADRIGS